MRVTFAVGERVVLEVGCRPLDRIPFHSHRAKDQQEELHRGVGYEAAVGEHAVIPHRDPDGDEEIHDRQERQVRPMYRTLPQETNSQAGGEQRYDDHHQDGHFVEETSNITIHWQPDFLTWVRPRVGRIELACRSRSARRRTALERTTHEKHTMHHFQVQAFIWTKLWTIRTGWGTV